METIRNYLEAMFANMPNTPAAQKAKRELYQMMEDKYSELIKDGKSENEAVGTVISEFGNLEELSEDLGLKEEYQQVQKYTESHQRRHITLEEAKRYLLDQGRHALFIAAGVFLCCSCVVPVILEENYGWFGMMLMIVTAVCLFCYSSFMQNKWNFMKNSLCSIDYQTATFLQQQLEEKRPNLAVKKTLGIVICIICWIPCALLDMVFGESPLMDRLEPISLFLLVAIGVFLIVWSNIMLGSYKRLLNLNDKNTISGSYVPEQEEDRYVNDTVAVIMSVYWPTVTSIYLIWSFLSFQWHLTWIIWPIAAIICSVIKNNLKINR